MTVLCLVEYDDDGPADSALRALTFARALTAPAGPSPAAPGPAGVAEPGAGVSGVVRRDASPASAVGGNGGGVAGRAEPGAGASGPAQRGGGVAGLPGRSSGLAAVIAGSADPALMGPLAAFGVMDVYTAESELLARYAPIAWARTLAGLITETGASAVVAAGTDRGNEVMAHLAALTDLPMAANCISVARAADSPAAAAVASAAATSADAMPAAVVPPAAESSAKPAASAAAASAGSTPGAVVPPAAASAGGTSPVFTPAAGTAPGVVPPGGIPPATATADMPAAAGTGGGGYTPAPVGTLGQWRLVRQRWGGSLLEDAVLDASTALLTVAVDAVPAVPAALPGPARVHVHRPVLSEADVRVAVTATAEPAAAVSLSTARVVIGGGRGVGGPAGFAPLEELAALLGGAVGVSRVVTSLGWRPHKQQVGQTGTRITPDLYLACGISGAIQHMAGCAGAQRIVAINIDPDAPIVSRADYAVIGDLKEVIPALVAAIRARGG